MKYQRLGNSGLVVSRIVLGCMSYGSRAWRPWVLEEDEARPFFRKAVELGINCFDTANMYSVGRSEEITGRMLREFTRRDEVVLATKVYFPMGEGPNRKGLSRKHIFDECDASLKRLRVDYIDLYQIHRWDDETPLDETLEALHDLVKAGKVRYIGASSMYAWQFATALHRADARGWTRFVSMQNHYNLVYREEEREMLPLCRAEGVGVLPWSPLARGFLTGSRRRGQMESTLRAKTDDYSRHLLQEDKDFDVLDAVLEVAEKRGIAPAQIALAWLLHQPGVTAPIVGATKPEHLEEAVRALDVRLDNDEIAALEEPYKPHPVLGMPPPARA